MTFTVTIAGVSPNPEVYGGLPAATAYIGARIGDAYETWRGLSTDDQGRTLVSATSYLDRIAWKGTATTPAVGGTTLQWPRTGVTRSNGTAVDPNTVPVEITSATFELAALIADDPDIVSQLDSGSNIEKVNAGGAGVTFFAPTSANDGSASRLPYVVQQLIGQFTSSAGVTVIGGFGQSGNACLDDGGDFDRSEPF